MLGWDYKWQVFSVIHKIHDNLALERQYEILVYGASTKLVSILLQNKDYEKLQAVTTVKQLNLKMPSLNLGHLDHLLSSLWALGKSGTLRN